MTYNRDFSESSGRRQYTGGGGGSMGGSSLIDRDSYFNGEYRTPHDLRIEGEYEGEIRCDGTLTIAESARVSGTINAGNILISGVVQGEVSCSERFDLQHGQGLGPRACRCAGHS